MVLAPEGFFRGLYSSGYKPLNKPEGAKPFIT